MKKIVFMTAALLIAMSSCDNIGALKKQQANQEQTTEQEQPANVAQEQPATDAQGQPASVEQTTTVAPQDLPKVLPEDLLYGRVTDPDGYTNIRKEPTTKAPIVRRYNSGEYLYYFPLKSGWSLVYSGANTNTFMGYMSTDRIVRVNPNSTSQNAESYKTGYITDPVDTYVNIRKGPGTNFAITGRIDTGTDVYYQPATSGWVKIYNDDKVFLGYVAKSRVK